MVAPKTLRAEDRPKPLRVMVCIRNLQAGAGGMERTAANLATHLTQQGYTAAVAYRQREGGQSIYNLDRSVEHFPFDGSVDSLVEIAERLKPDVIVYFYATFDEASHIVALCQTGFPLVLHEGSNPDRVVNNNWAIAKGITPRQAELERLAMMSGCARFRFTLPQYRDSLPLALKQFSVAFPNAFAPADPNNISLRSNSNRKIFLNIGGLKKVKNVMAAVRAFARIANDIPDWDFHIFSAGPQSNPIRPILETFISQHRLTNRVKLFDPTPHIGREYGRSHVHVIASKEEGLPNCVAEASRHGLPSIGFACCAGTNSMIVDDHNGLLVECGEGEIQALAEAMRRAATDDLARERWGTTALRESGIYDPEHIFAQWETLIREAAADKVNLEERMRRRFGDGEEWRRLRAVQRASLGAKPWPVSRSALPTRTFDEAPPTVSIVVPLFNKENYIADTLETIAACSYPTSAREVIIVDDCSTDASAVIAGEICERNNWTLIQNARNSGLSVARNTGLDAAKGEYVHFWDADDLYSPNGIEKILRAMHEDAADIGTGIATRDGQIFGQYALLAQDASGLNYAQRPETLTTPSACFKVYRRDFLNIYGLRFEPGLHMQDSAFNLCAFPLAERIVMSSAVLGEYRFLGDSASKQFNSNRFSSSLRVEEKTYEHYIEYGLHGLDVLRQMHILTTVLPQFLKRAQQNYSLIDDKTNSDEINFDFLEKLQFILPRLSKGLTKMTKSGKHLRLAYFAVREGYFIWLPPLLKGELPNEWRPELLAENPEEKSVIEGLASGLRHSKI